MTVDLRNTDEVTLRAAEARFATYVSDVAGREGVDVERRTLARFEPVDFDDRVIEAVERNARDLGYSTRRMPSGAGHDAQMLSRICPTGMVFVPSVNGISHNVTEYTEPSDIEAGANVLLRTMLELAATEF
jgi:N-carbamoyl-L-amino-acid hydrolase